MCVVVVLCLVAEVGWGYLFCVLCLFVYFLSQNYWFKFVKKKIHKNLSSDHICFIMFLPHLSWSLVKTYLTCIFTGSIISIMGLQYNSLHLKNSHVVCCNNSKKYLHHSDRALFLNVCLLHCSIICCTLFKNSLYQDIFTRGRINVIVVIYIQRVIER